MGVVVIPPPWGLGHEQFDFSGIPVVAIGLALSVELKVAVAMIGHEEQLFRWVWCRKTPASVCSGPLAKMAELMKFCETSALGKTGSSCTLGKLNFYQKRRGKIEQGWRIGQTFFSKE